MFMFFGSLRARFIKKCIYMYIYFYKVQNLIFLKQCLVHRSRARYMLWRKKKTNKLPVHPASLFRGRPRISGSPDVWATTKKACRDELAVNIIFFFATTNMFVYVCILYILAFLTNKKEKKKQFRIVYPNI